MIMMVVPEPESNGQKPVHHDDHHPDQHDHHHDDQQGVQSQGRRHPRWTREETLCLIRAKEITESTPNKGRKTSSSVGPGGESSEPKWVMISAHCKQAGVDRGPAQCRKRWSNLIGDFKKVKAWEDNLLLMLSKSDSDNNNSNNNNNSNSNSSNKAESFWCMRNDMRKQRKLPVSFDREVFRVLAGGGGGCCPPSLAAVSPLAAAAPEVSDDLDQDEEEDEEEEEMEPEEMANDDRQNVETEDLLEENERGIDNEDDGPAAKEFCSPEPISAVQHHQAFQNQKPNEKADPNQETGAFRQSWPGISYWNSQQRGKKRRLSTDGNQANDMDNQIVRTLETNNKMLHYQLDIHNKNCQLDREQRKENSEALVAALGKLTDAIVKIAEKL